MPSEKIELTDWKSKEEEVDRAWIEENLAVLQTLAESKYNENGHGAVFVNTTEFDRERSGHPCFFLTQANVQDMDNEETLGMVRDYDPHQEFVLVLIKQGKRGCAYRVSYQNLIKINIGN